MRGERGGGQGVRLQGVRLHFEAPRVEGGALKHPGPLKREAATVIVLLFDPRASPAGHQARSYALLFLH